jgi:hypothetical protein
MQRTFARASAFAGVSMLAAWMAFGQSAAAPKVIEMSAKKYEFRLAARDAAPSSNPRTAIDV